MRWAVVKDVFAVRLGEHREPYTEFGAPVQSTNASEQNSGGFSLTRGEANDKWKLQNCPMVIYAYSVILIKLPSANDLCLSPPASGQHTFCF